jgi:hypothetical protein
MVLDVMKRILNSHFVNTNFIEGQYPRQNCVHDGGESCDW